MITGSCLCGDARFEANGSAERAHGGGDGGDGGRCRKARGGACSSHLILPLEGLRWTAGETAIRRFQPPDAERFVHAFCARCSSKAGWVEIQDDRPRFDQHIDSRRIG